MVMQLIKIFKRFTPLTIPIQYFGAYYLISSFCTIILSFSMVSPINLVLKNYSIHINTTSTLVCLYIFIKKYIKEKNAIDKISKVLLLKYFLIGSLFSVSINLIIVFILKPPIYQNRSDLYISMIVYGLLSPIAEEITFHGLFFNRMRKYCSDNTSMIITAIIFSLLHINLAQSLFVLCLSLITSKYYMLEKNILIPIILHISANTIALIINYLLY